MFLTQTPSCPKHLSFLDKGPVLLYLNQLEIGPCPGVLTPGERRLVVSVWMQKSTNSEEAAPKSGVLGEMPRVAEQISKNFTLIIERECSPGPSGLLEPQFMQPEGLEGRTSFVRFIEHVKGASFNDVAVSHEPLPKAPAVPLPKDASLSTQFCITVRRESDRDILGLCSFHLWELVYNPERKVALPLGRTLMPEECIRPLNRRRHSWSGMLHGGGGVLQGALPMPAGPSERGISRPRSPRRPSANRRRRHKSVSYMDLEEDDEIEPHRDLPTPFRSPSYRARRRGSNASMGAGSSGTEASIMVPGVLQISLAPHSITQRNGGVLGISLIDQAILTAALRRAFDVPYDSSWIIGKSLDPLVQAAYDFWGTSHALIPQQVCVKGILLFEDLFKQDETFERPIEATQGDHYGLKSDRYLALSFSDASTSSNFRLDRALRSQYRKPRSSSCCEATFAPMEVLKREASFVDNDLLMYKIRLWDDQHSVEPDFQDTWDTLPGDRAYRLKMESLKMGPRPLGQGGRARAATADSSSTPLSSRSRDL